MDYSIGELGALTGVTADTLRYYERIGLLGAIGRDAVGRRRYSEADLGRLRFIRRAQSMNFSLREIADLLTLRDSPGDVRAEVRRLTEQKLEDISGRIQELSQLRDELAHLVVRCRASAGHCPIIQHMNEE